MFMTQRQMKGGRLALPIAVWLLFAVPAAASTTHPAGWVDTGTAEMAALLKERAAQVDPKRLTLFVNDQRADLAERALRVPRPMEQKLELQMMYATELMNAGRNEDSVKAWDVFEEMVKSFSPEMWAQGGAGILLRKATAYMRMGEEQNCHLLNNADSCLLPIKGQGIHQKRMGSTRAIETLMTVLDKEPDNLSARWLLNIAHMTLGSYPAGVPKKFLIEPSVFASDYPLPRFPNVARQVGVDVFAVSGGAILDDFDNDGRLDLMVSSMGFADQMRYFHNSGDGTFEERTESSGLLGEVGGLNMIQADYDNDGFVDVLVLRGGWLGRDGRFPLSLLRNNGDGTFSDVTKAAGLLRFAPTQTAVWLDYDGDGWLDLFVGNESGKDDPYPCHLFHSNRDGTFTDVAKEVGVDVVGFVKGVVSADYDNDGRPDLFLSLMGGDKILFHNDGAREGQPWHFTDVAKAAGVTEPLASFGALFFDYDNDGWPDLFVTGYGGVASLHDQAQSVAADYLGLPTTADRGRLYHNRGDGTFENVTKAMGLYKVVPTMGLNFGDLDNDGWLDMYLGTGNPDFTSVVPKRMFRNDGGKRFQDVTTAGDFGHLQKGHAICFGDINNDGHQDVFEELGGAYLSDKAYSALYLNPGNENLWIGLDLEGVHSNRSAIGARIAVTVAGKHGSRTIHRTVGSGGSFGGNPLRQHVGIGDAQRVVSVVVRWPATGETQTFADLKPGHWFRIREGVSEARMLVRPSFRMGDKARGKEMTKTSR
jgi:hypothetical protein